MLLSRLPKRHKILNAMEVAVLTKEGKDTGRKISLNESIFEIDPNDHAIYLDVKQILANRRQGTHKAKERAEVQGSSRKIKSKKAPVAPVLAISGTPCSVMEVVLSVPVHAIIHSSLIKRLSPLHASQPSLIKLKETLSL